MIGSPRTWVILQHPSALFMTSPTGHDYVTDTDCRAQNGNARGRSSCHRGFQTSIFNTRDEKSIENLLAVRLSIYSAPIDKDPWCLFGWVGSPLIKYGGGKHGGLRTPLAQEKEPIGGEGRPHGWCALATQ